VELDHAAGTGLVRLIPGALSLIIWLYLLLGRGGFWRFRVESAPEGRVSAARVHIVIPARDEAESIGETIGSLLAQDYAGPVRIFLVDDHSSDGTAEIACEAGDVAVIQSAPLPPGWTGKLWAVSQGVNAAAGNADFLLLTDADIVHSADSVRGLVARAEAGPYELVSYMAELRCATLAERALIPAFVFFFFMLYPPAWISRRNYKTAGAAGGCMLIRPSALDRIGGIAAIRGELIDDCALAARVKASGGTVWLGLTHGVKSLRGYAGFGDVSSMIARTAFTQLDHSVWMLFGTVIGLLLTFAAPVLCWNWLGLAAFLLMTLVYLPAVRFYRLSPLWALTLPFAAVFYLGATVQSAIRYWSGRGGQWKGRVQDGLK
jgi:hopene-associated glycosyltransferase HpnB